MKTLDCRPVIDGIDDTRSDMDSLREQVGDIQRAVRDFYSLDDALKGKMGESIRDFFQHVNEPLLIYLHQSLIDYDNTLSEMKENVEAFESNEKGFVRQAFLEEEVKEGFDNVEERATELTDDANSILANVEDLVTVKKIDDSEVLENVEKGKKKVNKIVEKLTELDEQETSQLEKTKEDLNEMKSYLSDMKSGLNNGDLSLKDFDIDALRDIDSYRTIMNDIYGDGYVEGKEMEPILDKMLNGESLNSDEREKLYDYFQNEYLDDESKAEVESIADSIGEDGGEALKNRLNDKVLESKDSLANEMAMVQGYVFTGDKESKDVDINRDTKQKLESYLLLLQDYHKGIQYQSVNGRDEISKEVENLQYHNKKGDISGHFFESTLKTERTEVNYNPASKDPAERVEPPVNDFYYHESEVDYYTNARASGLYEHLKNENLLEERANYTSDFITKEAVSKLVGSLKSPADTVVDTSMKIAEYDAGKRELDSDIEMSEAKKYAGILSMEFAISQYHTVPGKAVSSETKAQLHPTQETYEVLNRWKRVKEYNPDIPYPKEHVEAQNWEEIGESLARFNGEVQGEDMQNLYDYITDDSNNSKKSVEELANSYD